MQKGQTNLSTRIRRAAVNLGDHVFSRRPMKRGELTQPIPEKGQIQSLNAWKEDERGVLDVCKEGERRCACVRGGRTELFTQGEEERGEPAAS